MKKNGTKMNLEIINKRNATKDKKKSVKIIIHDKCNIIMKLRIKSNK